MIPFYFYHIETLRRSMRHEEKDIERFVVSYNNKKIDCILDISCDPLELMISVVGETLAFVLQLERDPDKPFKYLCNMPDKNFYDLRDCLQLRRDPEHLFSSFDFLLYIDKHLPAKASPEIVNPAALLPFREKYLNNAAREEGYIFRRWLPHDGMNNGHVTQQNLEKTRLLLGTGARDFCAKNDISAQWTTNPNKAGPLTRPQDYLSSSSSALF